MMNKENDDIVWQLKGTTGHGICLGDCPSKTPCVNFFSCDTTFNRALGKSQRGDGYENYQHFVVLDRKRLGRVDYVKEIVDVKTFIPFEKVSSKEYHKYDNPYARRALLDFSHCQVVRLVLENRRKIYVPSDCILGIGSTDFPKYFETKVNNHNEEANNSISLFLLKE